MNQEPFLSNAHSAREFHRATLNIRPGKKDRWLKESNCLNHISGEPKPSVPGLMFWVACSLTSKPSY